MKLRESVRFLKGCGPVRVEALKELGIHTIENLLRHYPREWVFARKTHPGDAPIGDAVIITGKLSVPVLCEQGGMVRASVISDSPEGPRKMPLMWFNSPYLMKALRGQPKITVWGRVSEYCGSRQMVSPRWQIGEAVNMGKTAMPIYPASAKASSEFIGKLIKQVLGDDLVNHDISPKMRKAYHGIHRPKYKKQLAHAKHTLKVDELTRLFFKANATRVEIGGGVKAPVISSPKGHLEGASFEGSLPFTLTLHQRGALSTVYNDLEQEIPMHRLIQGDVGCGKTVVAVGASVAVTNAGYQTVVLCPTQVLARQHHHKWKEYMGDCGYSISLRTGGMVDDSLHADIIVGTTALLSCEFPKMGLLIIDEEQKFGREQKELLAIKYLGIHRLYMTATPIPQALCMTAFGDLDVTTIKTMPPKRRERVTELVYPDKANSMKESLTYGDRIYVVFPRIEGPGGLLEAYGRVKHPVNVAIMHGDRSSKDNEASMRCFKEGHCHTLFCTSMVEVGVDVPGANIMIIHEAHMFGLSQLHQLRGRIGRGDRPSVCYLMANTDDPAALEKLQFVADHDNGFDIAQYDLAVRGPGELVGNRQTGLSELKLVDLVSDFDLIKLVRQEVFNGR